VFISVIEVYASNDVTVKIGLFSPIESSCIVHSKTLFNFIKNYEKENNDFFIIGGL